MKAKELAELDICQTEDCEKSRACDCCHRCDDHCYCVACPRCGGDPRECGDCWTRAEFLDAYGPSLLRDKMNRAIPFCVYLSWGDGDHELEIIGGRTPHVPARTNCLPEDACPAEGLELEDVRVFMMRNSRRRELPQTMQDELMDNDGFAEAIQEAIDMSLDGGR